MQSVVLCLFAGFGLPAADGPQIHEIPDLVFGKGGGADLLLDLAMPADGDGPFPVVVCIHGGGWVDGNRKQMENTLQAFARRGFVAVSPDYRLAPHDHFPAPVEDCKAAVRWLRANAKTYKIDPDHIGRSALRPADTWPVCSASPTRTMAWKATAATPTSRAAFRPWSASSARPT